MCLSAGGSRPSHKLHRRYCRVRPLECVKRQVAACWRSSDRRRCWNTADAAQGVMPQQPGAPDLRFAAYATGSTMELTQVVCRHGSRAAKCKPRATSCHNFAIVA